MIEKRYSEDGYLIVSELSRCPFFEKDPSAQKSCGTDCFFCKYSDFRKHEYIERVGNEAMADVLYSVCHNEKNKKDNIGSEKTDSGKRG